MKFVGDIIAYGFQGFNFTAQADVTIISSEAISPSTSWSSKTLNIFSRDVADFHRRFFDINFGCQDFHKRREPQATQGEVPTLVKSYCTYI